MRKSLQDIAHIVRQIPYPSQLPDEIKHLHCYIADSGHCILAVPESLLAEAKEDPELYEVPLPVKYVISKGWRTLPGTDCITVDVSYDEFLGAVVPDGFEEWS